MLDILIPSGIELWDSGKNEFVYSKETTLHLEHSLLSLSKWESKWCVPFLSKEDKTYEQTLDYIKYMTVNKVDPMTYNFLTVDHIEQVNRYIELPMTASKFYDQKKGSANNKPVTAELIYYWMLSFHIPFECEKWHLNRLLALIRVCSRETTPPEKMSRQELINRNHKLNEARKRKFNTKG